MNENIRALIGFLAIAALCTISFFCGVDSEKASEPTKVVPKAVITYVTNNVPDIKVNVTVTNTFNVLIVPSGNAAPDDSTPDNQNQGPSA